MAKKTTPKTLAETRERIRAAQAKKAAAEKAPRPRAEVLEDVRSGIRALGERAKLNAHELVAPRGGSLRVFDTKFASIAGHARAEEAGRVGAQMINDFGAQTAGLFAAVVPEALEELAMRQVDAELAALPAPLGAEERRERLAELDRELRRLELEEERIAEGLEAEGREVLRRSDADPAVVLGFAEEATG